MGMEINLSLNNSVGTYKQSIVCETLPISEPYASNDRVQINIILS